MGDSGGTAEEVYPLPKIHSYCAQYQDKLMYVHIIEIIHLEVE
jgi:hypothetical protein